MQDNHDVMSVLEKNLKKVSANWKGEGFDPDKSLREFGVDSLDSVQVLFDSMKDLGIRAMDIEVFDGKSVRQVVELLKAKLKLDETSK